MRKRVGQTAAQSEMKILQYNTLLIVTPIYTVVGRLPPTLSFKVYDSQILPILEYGSDLWYKARDNKKLELFNLTISKAH